MSTPNLLTVRAVRELLLDTRRELHEVFSRDAAWTCSELLRCVSSCFYAQKIGEDLDGMATGGAFSALSRRAVDLLLSDHPNMSSNKAREISGHLEFAVAHMMERGFDVDALCAGKPVAIYVRAKVDGFDPDFDV